MIATPLDTLVTVFGGSGFLGRHVVRALAKEGYRIRVAVRNPNLAYASQYKYTPLMTAAAAGQIEMLGMLLAAGADVRATNTIGQTALHVAFAGEGWEFGITRGQLA